MLKKRKRIKGNRDWPLPIQLTPLLHTVYIHFALTFKNFDGTHGNVEGSGGMGNEHARREQHIVHTHTQSDHCDT